MTTTIFISIALLVVCWGIHNHDDVTNFLRHIDRFVEEEVEVRHIPHLSDGDLRSLGFLTIGSRQRIRSAATAWVPQVICLCSFDSHVLKKVLNKYNDMFFFSWEIWYKKSFIYVSFHRSPIQTPRRCRRMLNKLQRTRKKERARSCELDWYLEIMCIFSHESIEKSWPHNLQDRILAEKSTGKRARLQMSTRKMERERYCELIWCSNVTWFISWTLIQNHFPHKMHKWGID